MEQLKMITSKFLFYSFVYTGYTQAPYTTLLYNRYYKKKSDLVLLEKSLQEITWKYPIQIMQRRTEREKKCAHIEKLRNCLSYFFFLFTCPFSFLFPEKNIRQPPPQQLFFFMSMRITFSFLPTVHLLFLSDIFKLGKILQRRSFSI